MQTLFLGQNLVELREVDSTNNFAATMLNTTNVADGTVILAHHQFAGKGQRGSQWKTEPAKNLTFSIVLSATHLNNAKPFDLSMASVLGIADYLLLSHNLPAKVKWPNDVYVNSKKIAGILIETSYKGHALKGIIVGIGLNINQHLFSDEPLATSVRRELKQEIKLELKPELLKLLSAIEKRILQLRSSSLLTKLKENYYENLLGYQHTVEFVAQEKEQKGKIIGVNESGNLLIDITGEIKAYDIKDIKFLP